MSINLLAEAGFKNVFNIIDGMEGTWLKILKVIIVLTVAVYLKCF